jgi:branched-chain amino acid aminotransferase
MDVVERNITMSEVQEAVEEGRMVEAFGSGTAAVLSPVGEINYNGNPLMIPLEHGQTGDLCQRVWNAILGIQYGEVEHDWSVKC